VKILGISSNYHDASAAIIMDGVVVAAAAEERFTLQKHDPSFPTYSAQFCLELAGCTTQELDLVVYH
jgi:carbamoyltransferase